MTDYRSYLVPGRACGGCTACCTALLIDEPALAKLPEVTCAHCTAGCAIYPTRPATCRGYHCAWRGMPNLDESWRPDLSGVLIQWGTPPRGWPTPHAVELLLIGPPETLASDRVAGLIAGFVTQRVATELYVPRGAGFHATTALLNPFLTAAVARGDRAEVKALLRSAHATMIARPALPVAG